MQTVKASLRPHYFDQECVSRLTQEQSTVPAFTAFFEVKFLNKKLSSQISCYVTAIVAGVILATTEELEFDIYGFVAALCSSVLTSMSVAFSPGGS